MEAFLTWYDAQLHRLFNYIAYRVRDHQLAEDLTATACEKAVRSIATYDPQRGSMNAWMFAIGRDVLRKHYRRASHQPGLVPLDDLPPITTNTPSLEVQTLRREQFRQVLRYMPTLSDDQQEAIALRYGAGLSYTEIAELMGCDTNRVGVLLHRGIARLQEALTQEETHA